MAYMLDANVFIGAKNGHYGFDVVPGFWDWIQAAHTRGLVYSTDSVREELLALDDELTIWTGDLPDTFFIQPDDATLAALRGVSTWASNEPRFHTAAVSIFFDSADYFLTGCAPAHDHIVVTHEKSEPNSRKTVKLPDACAAVGVQWMGPYEMLKVFGAVFVLQ